MSGSSQITQKLWSYCNVRRDDGMSYGDYVEQLTYLLLWKMAADDRKTHRGLRSDGFSSVPTCAIIRA